MTKKNYIFIILITGYLVYFNSFLNGFVLDDLFQIVNNPNIVGWHNLFYYFFHQIGPYYRPLTLTTFSIFYNLGFSSFFYHLFQVNLHIANSIMLFLLFSSFFKKNHISLIAALIFLVHPINTEAVVYASEIQETYFIFFGLLGTLIIKKVTIRNLLILTILQLLALLSKETAALFIVIQGWISYLFNNKYFKLQAIGSGLLIAFYLAVRILLFGSINPQQFATLIPNSSSTASLPQRLINAPEIVFYYLKTFIFPKDLAVSQMWWNTSIDFNHFYLPLLFDLVFTLLIFVFGSYIYKFRRKVFKIFLLFSVWFFIGILWHIQIIPLDWTVADRWFYFPMIGLLGLIGLGLDEIENKRIEIIILGIMIMVISIFSLRTVVRNTNWYNQLTLTSHDIAISTHSGDLELNYAIALNQEGNYKQAIVHLKRGIKLIPDGYTLWDALGSAYVGNKQYENAISSYTKAIDLNNNYYVSYKNIATTYLLDFKPIYAKKFLENEALKKWPSDDYLWHLLGISDYVLNNKQEAYKDFKRAYEISPNVINTYYYMNMQENKPIQIKL